jgi:hypothetical protein
MNNSISKLFLTKFKPAGCISEKAGIHRKYAVKVLSIHRIKVSSIAKSSWKMMYARLSKPEVCSICNLLLHINN